jgi:two-component system response regulator FixJ
MAKPPKIYVVDDDDAARDSLEVLLSSFGHPVVSFASGNAFLEAVDPSWTGCIVLDVRMPGLNGPQVQEILADRGNLLPVIIVTGHGDLPMAVKAMKAGALDFIEKPFDEAVIMDSIDKALRHDSVERQRIDDTLQSRQRIDALTPREREVMLQVALGHPNKVVAWEMGISARTVEIHRARVIEKLQVRNLSELVRLVMHAGLLPEEADG